MVQVAATVSMGQVRIGSPKVYRCPSDPTMTPTATTNPNPPLSSGSGFAITSYSFNGQVFGNTCPHPMMPTTFQDGTSNTALCFERLLDLREKWRGPNVGRWGRQ